MKWLPYSTTKRMTLTMTFDTGYSNCSIAAESAQSVDVLAIRPIDIKDKSSQAELGGTSDDMQRQRLFSGRPYSFAWTMSLSGVSCRHRYTPSGSIRHYRRLGG